MTNQKLIDEIVADLLDLDPSFNEKEVRPLVAKFLSSRPEIEPTAEFRRQLYESLLAEIQKQTSTNKIINTNYMFNKFKFTLAALTVVAALFVITSVLPKKQTINLSGNQEINTLSANAFGSLATLTATSRNQSGGGGMGGDAIANPTTTVDSESKMMVPGMGGGSSELSYFAPINYNFTYTGEEFAVDSEAMSVYQRQKGFGVSELGAFLDRFNVGLFNISRFANATLDYITASQNVDFGYTLSLDTRQGYVNIYENWEKWQTPDRLCQDEACYNRYRLTPEQVPADDAIIAIANAFLDEYGVNRSNYGVPVIQHNYWRTMYENATDKSLVYIPDTAQVVYPAKIGQNEVYDQSGNKSGMYVSVNLRVNRVSSLGELTTQRYDGSEYRTEQDTERLLKVAVGGGYQQYFPYATDANVETKTLELLTPTVGFVRLWQYTNNQSREMFVPSLIFPIKDAPVDLYMKNITVPLIKDILDTQNRDTVMPMPLIEPAAQ
jgi:hypothetical protein